MSDAERAALLSSIAAAEGMDRVARLLDYQKWLPCPAVARCPHTGAVVHHSVDTGGIDGPWWRYDWPQRPPEELPSTFFAFTGALRLGDPLPNLDWLVKPGPEAPFVVRRLLLIEGMKAVVSALPVGGWDGWAISYFSDRPRDVERCNDWGACRHWVDGGRGVEWSSTNEDAEVIDFDLGPWIERGSLQWIAPGDAEMRLQSTATGCPYLGWPGRRTFTRIQYGTAWEPIPAAAPR